MSQESSNESTSNQSNSSDEQGTPSQETKPKSNRGRKPIPNEQKRKGCRYIKCDHCNHVMEWWFGKQEYRKPRVVESDLSKQEKTKIYNQRYQAKKKAQQQQGVCLVDE